MHIDGTNYSLGNKAMASVLLLYYHLLREGGITSDQTVYLTELDFDAFMFIDVTVAEEYANEIDERLIREGAAITLLCDLNDEISEFEDDYLRRPVTERIVSYWKDGRLSQFNGVDYLMEQVQASMVDTESYDKYQNALQSIYRQYVVGRLESLLGQKKP